MPFESPRGRRQVAIAKSVPAPVGGLNARDSLAAMAVTDAIVMRNWYPLPFAVAVRKGWQIVATIAGEHEIQTIAVHSIDDSSTGQHMLICTGDATYVLIYYNDVPTLTLTDFFGWCMSTMFSTEGGDFTYMVNGLQLPRVYQAAAGGASGLFTTVNESLVNPPPAFDVFGVDPKLFATVTWHHGRLWFAEQNTLRAWYLPSGQVGGEATEYNFGAFFTRGGYIQAIISWTVDAGEGMDDYLAVVSSMGEVLLYRGNDPDSTETFVKQGLFDIGSPVGRRCWCRYGGDVLLITRDGVIPLSKALQSTRVSTNIALTDKIQNTISELISANADVPGWQVMQFPNANQIWLTAPESDGVRIFSMNTITGAWCEFGEMDIRCMVLHRDLPLFGRPDGLIGLGWVGNLDKVDYLTGVGQSINAEVLTAYNYFEDTAHNKRWTMCRPIFQAGGAPAASVSISVDYGIIEGTSLPLPPVASSTPLWDVGIWDLDQWPSKPTRYRSWVSIQGLGYCAALNLRVRQNTPLLWTATDFVYEPGAVV